MVESPADVAAIEQSQNYKGRYFVLHGHLSPIDGIGADELGLPLLDGILAAGNVTELILATNPTIEGDATAAYIAQLANLLLLLPAFAAWCAQHQHAHLYPPRDKAPLAPLV